MSQQQHLQKNQVTTTTVKPFTVMVGGVSEPDLSKGASYVVITNHSSTQQTGQLLNRIGDI